MSVSPAVMRKKQNETKNAHACTARLKWRLYCSCLGLMSPLLFEWKEMSASGDSNRILVTGFGPFGRHSVNSSWVAVQELNRLWTERRTSYKLELKEVPVSYSYIAGHLEDIYKEANPMLCIHVGVSSNKSVKLEKYGRNSGYLVLDTEGSYPSHTQCIQHGPERLRTLFDLEYIQFLLKNTLSGHSQVDFNISEDAGRYLCEYIYYYSLHLDACPVLFVHVPPLNDPYTSQQLGQALKDIIETLLNIIEH